MAPRHGRSDRWVPSDPVRTELATGALFLGLVVLILAAPSLTPPLRAWAAGWKVPTSSTGATGGIGPQSTNPPGPCNPRTPTPSALLIPNGGPSGSAPAGTNLSVTVEVAVLSTSLSRSGVNVSMPSLTVSFPNQSGPPVSVYLAPATIAPRGPGWASAVSERGAVRLGAPMIPPAGASALLSSQKLAVLANAPYGDATLGVRWNWTESFPNGSAVDGPWSTLTSAAAWPNSEASVFLPAPFVAADPLTPSPLRIGSNFTATLSGEVGGRYFFLELESPVTGHVGQVHGATAPPGVTALSIGLPILNYDHYLDPGPYLVHVHDGCGAMLHSLSVTAVYAPSAQVTVSTQPSGCGGISLNGTTYRDGSTAVVRPSATPFSLSASGCPGVPQFTLSGGLYLESAGALRVSSSGNLSVTFS